MAAVAQRAKRGRPLSFGALCSIVPEEFLLKCLRLTSARPDRRNWADYISPQTALTMLLTDSALSELAWLHNLEIGSSSFLVKDCELIISAEPKQLPPHLLPFLRALTSILDRVAEDRLERRKLPRNAIGGDHFSRQLRSVTVQCCSPSFDLLGVLSALERPLAKLDITGKRLLGRHVRSIANHCRGLETLHLCFDSVADLSPVWDSVLPTLRTLRVNEPVLLTKPAGPLSRTLAGRVSALAAAGARPLSLELVHTGEGSQSGLVAPVCAQFGDHLTGLHITDDWDLPDLLSVLSRCTKAQVDMDLFGTDVSDYLSALSFRARSLTFDAGEPFWEQVALSLHSCTLVEELDMTFPFGDCADFLKCMLTCPVPKAHLKSVSIRLGKDPLDKDENCVSALGRHVHSLTHFHCEAYEFYDCCFQRLALGNPRLKKVEIVSTYVCEDSELDDLDVTTLEEERALVIMEDFFPCPVLEKLSIEGTHFGTEKSVAIAQMSEAFEAEHVNLVVGGMDYCS